MSLSIDAIEKLIDAAVAVEAWFTHVEVTDPDKFNFNEYNLADRLRGALHSIEREAIESIKRAELQIPLFKD